MQLYIVLFLVLSSCFSVFVCSPSPVFKWVGLPLSNLWVRREGGRHINLSQADPPQEKKKARRPFRHADSLHEWRVICTNFRANKSTCQRKETWKGRCPTAQLKCNCRWWNSVGWRITAVREERLHEIWQLAWLLLLTCSPSHTASCTSSPLFLIQHMCDMNF